ncbi:MAG: hypothetical protein ACK501_23745, partial [Planctomycetota bacterium]
MNPRRTWSLGSANGSKANLRVPQLRGGPAFRRQQPLEAGGEDLGDLGEALGCGHRGWIGGPHGWNSGCSPNC